MTKQKIFLFIPLIIIAGLLIYSWITFLLLEYYSNLEALFSTWSLYHITYRLF